MIEAERSLVLTADQRYGDCFRQDSLIVTLKTTLLALFELLPVPIPQQTLYARNDSTWCASFSSVW
jgi:hypothetical protein